MSPVIELQPAQFTERLLPIFEAVAAEVPAGTSKLNPAHFFPEWRRLMELKVARTWESTGTVLGAILVPNTFSGESQALVVFWFAIPEVRGTGIPGAVFREFEIQAAKAGVTTFRTAAYRGLNFHSRKRSYEKHGYAEIESGFKKTL